MRSVIWVARVLVEPVLALGLLVLWSTGELARPGEHLSGYAALTLAVAVAVSRAAPRLALAGIGVTLLMQALLPRTRFDQEGWTAWAALLLIALVLGSSAPDPMRPIALGVLMASGVAVALLLNVPAASFSVSPTAPYPFRDSPPVGTVNGKPAGSLDIPVGTLEWSAGAALLVLAAWRIGGSYRAKRMQWAAEDRRRSADAARVVAEAEVLTRTERERIAQEVHDVTAHSLALILVQADGALTTTSGPPAVALSAIADSARRSLVEIRGLLEHLDSAQAVEGAGLTDLDALVGRMRDTGLQVRVEERGSRPPLPASAALAVHRIVQEALTNAMRHGVPGLTTVGIDWEGPGIALSIASPIAPGTTPAPAGRGITGMRERARLLGGWLTAGPDADRFLVTAHLPVPTAPDAA